MAPSSTSVGHGRTRTIPSAAVRAGLDLAERMARLTRNDGTLLAVRIGIATGPVMVGNLVGEDAAHQARSSGKPSTSQRACANWLGLVRW